ncbi:MAG: DNA polymerase III subunit gamma/tau [bacterium]
MSYLVLARKWRPHSFDEIVGQAHITQTLKNAISASRIAHAFIFSGARGVGKTTAARILAKALNCHKGPIPDPCNCCAICEDITRGTCPDVIEIDGASNNSVDDIRELRNKIHFMPAKARYRVYIIDEVHMLTTAAFNALLKTLEEPPSHIIFIMATTEIHKIPITILSRCQRFDFRKISIENIVQYIEQIIRHEGLKKVDKEALMLIGKMAEGSLRDALSLLDQAISFCGDTITYDQVNYLLNLVDRRLLLVIFKALINRDAQETFSHINKIFAQGYDIKYFAEQLLSLVRDIIVFKITDKSSQYFDAEQREEFSEICIKTGLDDLRRYFDMLVACIEKMRIISNPQLILELSLIKMCEMPHLQSITTLLKRLAALEEKFEYNDTKETLSYNENIIHEAIRQEPLRERSSEKKSLERVSLARESLEEKSLEKKKEKEESAHNGFNWQEVVHVVKKQSPLFGSILDNVEEAHLHGTALSLDIKNYTPFFQRATEDKKNITIFKKILKECTGEDITLQWNTVQKEAEPEADTETCSKKNNHAIIELLDREPMVQLMLDTFSASIIHTDSHKK